MTWGQWGNAALHKRYIERRPRQSHNRGRRRCHCGCKQWADWLGMANGVCLTSGCELRVRRWVRDGFRY